MAENPPHIVVVEDNPQFYELYHLFLDPHGQVDIYETAAAAEPVLQRGEYDLLVSDLALPGMDGEELMQRVNPRSHGKTGILFSCSTIDLGLSTVARIREKGVDEILTKDFKVLGGVVERYSQRIRDSHHLAQTA